MDYCGDAEDYLFALETFEASAPEKAGQIEESLMSEDWEALTTRVHSLKSTAGAIGATDLSERAKALELGAGSGDLETVKRDMPDLLKEYRLLRFPPDHRPRRLRQEGRRGSSGSPAYHPR
ncbi:MAG: Hpt domain-containing protein [Lachnospiraceae bacterium]|nr:Hpt domain-containing protein [Lachnospiraceae bacterium]